MEKDYAVQTVEKLKGDITQQMSTNIQTAVMMDVVWQKAAEKILGLQKKDEVGYQAWTLLGEFALHGVESAMGIKVKDLETLAQAIEGCYSGLLIPVKRTKDDKNRKEWSCLSCPFPTYGFEMFGVKEADHICVLWKKMTDAWLEGMLNAAGLKDKIRGKIETAICMGDKTCDFYVEYYK